MLGPRKLSEPLKSAIFRAFGGMANCVLRALPTGRGPKSAPKLRWESRSCAPNLPVSVPFEATRSGFATEYSVDLELERKFNRLEAQPLPYPADEGLQIYPARRGYRRVNGRANVLIGQRPTIGQLCLFHCKQSSVGLSLVGAVFVVSP